MKKIIVGLFAFVLLFAGHSAFASNVFNGQQGDCNPAVGIGVYPNNIPRDNNGCWTATSITADAGDTINVAMYYHNNTNSTLNGVSGSISKTGSGQDFTFTGKMYSSYGTQTIGTVQLHLTSNQTLTYSSSHWMRDADAVLSDTDTQVFNNDGGQISFGSVPPGWDNYGELLVVYKVGTTVTPPPTDCSITDFSASPNSIGLGESSTLSWHTTSDCTSVFISNVGSKPADGSTDVFPTYSNNYILQAKIGSTVYDTQTVHINVGQIVSQMSGNLTPASSSCTIAEGDSTCNIHFTWTTTNPAGVSAVTKDGEGTVGNGNNSSGTFTIDHNSNTFRLYNNSIELDTATVNGVCESGTSWNGYSCVDGNNNNGDEPEATTSTAYDVNEDSAELRGSVDMNDFDNGLAFFVYGQDENQIEDIENDYSTYSSIDEDGQDLQKESVDSNLDGSDSYTLEVSGLEENEDYYYSMCVQYENDNGNDEIICGNVKNFSTDDSDNNTNDCSIDDFYASKTSISSGSSSVLHWATTGCSSVYISSGVGSVSSDGSRTVYPTSTTTYTLSAYSSNGGDETETVQIAVNSTYYGACGITSVASGVGKTSATLNGITSNPNYNSASTYFEYGTTPSLGMRTNSRNVSGNSSFSENISGLIPGTTYYFRLVSNCSNGNAFGSLSTLRTASDTVPAVVTPIYIQGPTTYIGGGISSPIKLKIEDRFEFVARGDNINYTITYKNVGGSTLKDPVIQVVVPKGVSMTNTSDGTYSNDSHILTVPLKNLIKNAEGTIYLDAKINSIPTDTEKLVTTATLVYTNPSGVQESATAYVLNIPKNTGNDFFGAAAALFGGMLPVTLIGWLALILVVLMIVLFARKAIRR